MAATTESSFWGSVRIQARVIWALLLREIITRYGRRDLGFLWMFLGPMLLIIVIVTVHSFWGFRPARGGMSVVGFGITGYSGAFLWRSMANRCMSAVESNLALMYHRNVKVLDIYVSRILLEGAGETMAFAVLSFACVFIGLMQMPADILKVLGAWILLAWFGAALAITLGALSEIQEVIAKLWRPLNIVTLILSGAFYMVDWLPAPAQDLVLYFPMIHCMELFREGFFGTAIHAHYEVGYVIGCCLVLTLIGLLLVKVPPRRMILE